MPSRKTIPATRGASQIGRTALVLEGGGMRGIFAAGALDTFHEQGFDPFDLYLGVSAGACNLASHLAGQYQRNYRIYSGIMSRPSFISARKFITGGHYMDLDWLWDTLDREERLNVKAVIGNCRKRKKEFLIVTTSVESGSPVYVAPTEETLNTVLKASSAVPLFYRHPVACDAGDAVDGGVTDPIPVMEAYRRGARTIMVIRSRTKEYVKKEGMEVNVTGWVLRKHERLSRALHAQAARYREAVDFMHNPPEGVRIIHVAPDHPLLTKRTSRNIDDLREDYELGKTYGMNAIAAYRGMRMQAVPPTYL